MVVPTGRMICAIENTNSLSDASDQREPSPKGRGRSSHGESALQFATLPERACASRGYSDRLPPMKRMRTMTTAMTRSTWISPPIVYEETKPRSHRTSSTIAIVSSIASPHTGNVPERGHCSTRARSSMFAGTHGPGPTENFGPLPAERPRAARGCSNSLGASDRRRPAPTPA